MVKNDFVLLVRKPMAQISTRFFAYSVRRILIHNRNIDLIVTQFPEPIEDFA